MAARAGVTDLLRLGGRLGTGYLRERGSFDAGAIGCRWAREILARDDAHDIRIALPGGGLDLVTHADHSQAVLAAAPGSGGYSAGKLKANAMSFLAPHALTVEDGVAWQRLRLFNEAALATGGPHPFAQTFLERVRDAFSRTLSTRDHVEAAMARAMVGIVLGRETTGEPHAADDVRILFGVVSSPLRRKLLGPLYRSRRKRLYVQLERRWQESSDDEPTLIALARRHAPDAPLKQLLEQVPHWMFTFTGSGTDLLTRTLALITSRPEVHRRVLAELTAAGPLELADTMERLPYLNACLLETGRLFPPVTRTFHRSASAAPAALTAPELIHWFPLLQRGEELGSSVHYFIPERWLNDALDAPALASNLFLRGPRACPGSDLILFVCRAALARQLGELGIATRQSRLSRDPLPISFPKREARFPVSEASQ